MRNPVTPDELRKLFPHISQDCIDRSCPVGAMVPAEREQGPKPALDRNAQAKPRVRTGVAVCVTIIICRRRLLDSDNAVAAAKHLRDCIAKSLGIDDGDPRVQWQYGQQETRGKPGTIVLVEHL